MHPDQEETRTKGLKRTAFGYDGDGRATKKLKSLLTDDNGSGDEGNSSPHSVGILENREALSSGENVFTVNQEYARRFEHNKKREELQRCEYSFVAIQKILC